MITMTEVKDDSNIDAIKEDNARIEEEAKVTEEDIKFVIDTICKEAKHDRPAIIQLFYAMLSGMTHLGIHHKVNSKESGAGKSYVSKKVASYFPNDGDGF